MFEFPTQSVDGFGDRDDIALERDRQHGQILENKANKEAEKHQRLIDATNWANEGTPISQVVLEMIQGEVWSELLRKGEVVFDVEDIHEAVNKACIQLGLDEDRFSPSLTQDGFGAEIRLF